jgi:hypothetical protein
MNFLPAFYRVTITAMSHGTTGTGFIDPKKPKYYLILNSDGTFTNLPNDLAKAIDKARANYRWTQVLNHISSIVNTGLMLDIQTPGATINAAPTTVSFTVSYDRPGFLIVDDELNPGVQLSNEFAIKRLIARAMTREYIVNTEVLDPTPISAPAKAGPASVYKGETIMQITVGAAASSISSAETKITVVRLPNT